jgi:CHAT domain-containing protein
MTKSFNTYLLFAIILIHSLFLDPRAIADESRTEFDLTASILNTALDHEYCLKGLSEPKIDSLLEVCDKGDNLDGAAALIETKIAQFISLGLDDEIFTLELKYSNLADKSITYGLKEKWYYYQFLVLMIRDYTSGYQTISAEIRSLSERADFGPDPGNKMTVLVYAWDNAIDEKQKDDYRTRILEFAQEREDSKNTLSYATYLIREGIENFINNNYESAYSRFLEYGKQFKKTKLNDHRVGAVTNFYLSFCEYYVNGESPEDLSNLVETANEILDIKYAPLFEGEVTNSLVSLAHILSQKGKRDSANSILLKGLKNYSEMYDDLDACLRNQIESPIIRDKVGFYVTYDQFKSLTPMIYNELIAENYLAESDTVESIHHFLEYYKFAEEYGNHLFASSACIRLAEIHSLIGDPSAFDYYLRRAENYLQLAQDEEYISLAFDITLLILDHIELSENRVYIRKLERTLSTAIIVAERMKQHQDQYDLTLLLGQCYISANLSTPKQYMILTKADSLAKEHKLERDRSLDNYFIGILMGEMGDTTRAREIAKNNFDYFMEVSNFHLAYSLGIAAMIDMIYSNSLDDSDFYLIDSWIHQAQNATTDRPLLLILQLCSWDIHSLREYTRGNYVSSVEIIPKFQTIMDDVINSNDEVLIGKYITVAKSLLSIVAQTENRALLQNLVRAIEPMQWLYGNTIYGDTWFIGFFDTSRGPYNKELYDKYIRRIFSYPSTSERLEAKIHHARLLSSIFGEWEESIDFYEEALVEAKSLGKARDELEILYELGICYGAVRQTNLSTRRFNQAIDLARSTGNTEDLISILSQVLDAGSQQSNEEQFPLHATEYYKLAKSSGDYLNRIQSVGYLIDYYGYMQNPDSTIHYMNEGFQIKDSVENRVSKLRYLSFLRNCFNAANNDKTGRISGQINSFNSDGMQFEDPTIKRLYEELEYLKDFDLSKLDATQVNEYPFVYANVWEGKNLLREYWDGHALQANEFEGMYNFFSQLKSKHQEWGWINSIWYIDRRIKEIEKYSMDPEYFGFGFTYELSTDKKNCIKIIAIDPFGPAWGIFDVGDNIIIDRWPTLTLETANEYVQEKIEEAKYSVDGKATFRLLLGNDIQEIFSVEAKFTKPNPYSSNPPEELEILCNWFIDSAEKLIEDANNIRSYPTFANTYREFLTAYPYRYLVSNYPKTLSSDQLEQLLNSYESISTFNLINETIQHKYNLESNPLLVSEYLKYSDRIAKIQKQMQQSKLDEIELNKLNSERIAAYEELNYFERYTLESLSSSDLSHQFSFEENIEIFDQFEVILRFCTTSYLNNSTFMRTNKDKKFLHSYTNPELNIASKIKVIKNLIEHNHQAGDSELILQSELIELTNLLWPGGMVIPDALKDMNLDWLIIPEKSSYLIPMELLQFRYESDTTEYHYLGEIVNISYAPSLSSFVELTKMNRHAKADKSALLVSANPNIEDAENYASNLFNLRANYGNLKFVDVEVESINQVLTKRRLFKKRKHTDVLKSSVITERELKSLDLQNYEYVHIASHGVHDEENPRYSGLLLGADKESKEDGILQAHEIFPYKLSADLITLSSCFSGFGEIDPNEGNMGIYRSFLIAGAKSVIISLWNVDDKSTSILFSKFYDYLNEGDSKAQALRKAKMYLRKETTYSHPFYWAPFVLMGES